MLRQWLYAGGIILVISGLLDMYLWNAIVYLIPSWTLGAFSFAMGITLILTLHTYQEKKENAVS